MTAFVASSGVIATTSGIITQDVIKHMVKTGGNLPDVNDGVASFTGNTNHPQINEFAIELGACDRTQRVYRSTDEIDTHTSISLASAYKRM